MTARLADRVKETSTTTGTGTLDLDGAVSGFQTFVAGIGTGNSCYYAIVGGTEWEVGIGTVTDATPDTLSRTTVLASSNAGSLVSLSAGTKDVFCTAAADAFTLGGMVQIGTVTLGSDNATLASFTSISGNYNDLRLSIVGRTDQTTAKSIALRFNNDSGTNYSWQRRYSIGTATPTSDSASGQTSLTLGQMGSATVNANAVGAVTVDIPNYFDTTFHKAVLTHNYDLEASDGGTESYNISITGRWKSTAAITRVDIIVTTGNFKTGSSCTLYGIGRH